MYSPLILIPHGLQREDIPLRIAPAAKKWHDVRGGWVILWLMTFICAFPPLIGYSTTVSIGFVYGLAG
jgi:hypothetical protein